MDHIIGSSKKLMRWSLPLVALSMGTACAGLAGGPSRYIVDLSPRSANPLDRQRFTAYCNDWGRARLIDVDAAALREDPAAVLAIRAKDGVVKVPLGFIAAAPPKYDAEVWARFHRACPGAPVPAWRLSGDLADSANVSPRTAEPTEGQGDRADVVRPQAPPPEPAGHKPSVTAAAEHDITADSDDEGEAEADAGPLATSARPRSALQPTVEPGHAQPAADDSEVAEEADAPTTKAWDQDCSVFEDMLAPLAPLFETNGDTSVIRDRKAAAQKRAVAAIVQSWQGRQVTFASTRVRDVQAEHALTAKGLARAKQLASANARLRRAMWSRNPNVYARAFLDALGASLGQSCADCTRPTGTYGVDLAIADPKYDSEDFDFESGSIPVCGPFRRPRGHGEDECLSIHVDLKWVHRSVDASRLARGAALPAKGKIKSVGFPFISGEVVSQDGLANMNITLTIE